jgi:hypothetical protein
MLSRASRGGRALSAAPAASPPSVRSSPSPSSSDGHSSSVGSPDTMMDASVEPAVPRLSSLTSRNTTSSSSSDASSSPESDVDGTARKRARAAGLPAPSGDDTEMKDLSSNASHPDQRQAVSSSSAAPPSSQLQAAAAPLRGLPKGYKHVFVHERTVQRAGIDSRMSAAIHLTISFDAHFPGAPRPDPRAFVLPPKDRSRAVAAFLEGAHGLAMAKPIIPLALIDMELEDSCSGEQLAWLSAYRGAMDRYYDLFRRSCPTDDATQKAVAPALDEVNKLLDGLGDLQFAQLSKSWDQLLDVPTRFLRPPGSTDSAEQSVTVALHGRSQEAAFFLSYAFVSYGGLRFLLPDLHTALATALGSVPSTAAGAAPVTDPDDSSDDDGAGWQQQRGQRRRQRSRFGVIAQRVNQLRQSDAMKQAEALYKPDTDAPLLALAATITLRPMLHRYVLHTIDNFLSADCDVHDLANDSKYKRLVQLLVGAANEAEAALRIPEEAAPPAHFTVDQRIGAATADVWVREDLVAATSEALRRVVLSFNAAYPPKAALRFACKGYTDSGSAADLCSRRRPLTINLTRLPDSPPPTAAAPTLGPAAVTAAPHAVAAPLPGSAATWADRLARGITHACTVRRREQRGASMPDPRATKHQRPLQSPSAPSQPVPRVSAAPPAVPVASVPAEPPGPQPPAPGTTRRKRRSGSRRRRARRDAAAASVAQAAPATAAPPPLASPSAPSSSHSVSESPQPSAELRHELQQLTQAVAALAAAQQRQQDELRELLRAQQQQMAMLMQLFARLTPAVSLTPALLSSSVHAYAGPAPDGQAAAL